MDLMQSAAAHLGLRCTKASCVRYCLCTGPGTCLIARFQHRVCSCRPRVCRMLLVCVRVCLLPAVVASSGRGVVRLGLQLPLAAAASRWAAASSLRRSRGSNSLLTLRCVNKWYFAVHHMHTTNAVFGLCPNRRTTHCCKGGLEGALGSVAYACTAAC